MKLAALAAAMVLAPTFATAHPHVIISQAVRVIEEQGAYTQVEIEWRFDPYASEDEIPAIDEDKDGKISPEELALLVRDTMPSLQQFGFQTWLNTGDNDFQPRTTSVFTAAIENPATFKPPEWDRTAGDGEKMPENKRQEQPADPAAGPPRNLVYTFRFTLPQPARTFTITTYDVDDMIRFEVDKASLPAQCALDKHPTYKSEFVPGQPVHADRVTCRLP
ncbi:MAG: DUF1007 family protein [Reyranella sp.]|uniref:DUF1007 family protein n=1 Tax=Reyranella sp. TaxID=1929291 RepID=UPI001AC37613|nr:DUF1007 family protein [Reyranella sp.]MBN9090509.1 DUF1007 family protein [Reyranella sp.]